MPADSQKMPLWHISHRGGAAEAPENTLAAFQYAADECKTNMFELDVWQTADKQVVVAHDNNTMRMTGVDCLITATRFSDLPKTLPTDQLAPPDDHVDVKTFGGFARSYPPQPYLLLEDLFKSFPTMPMHIDVKEKGSRETVVKVIQLVRKYRREHLTFLSSFNDANVKTVRSLAPEVPVTSPPLRLLQLMIFYWIGYLPYCNLRESAISIPLTRHFFEWERKKLFNALHKRIGVFVAGKIAQWLTGLAYRAMRQKKFIRILKRRGVRVIYWVLNYDEDFQEAFDLGADGVMTDRPAALRKYLDKRGL